MNDLETNLARLKEVVDAATIAEEKAIAAEKAAEVAYWLLKSVPDTARDAYILALEAKTAAMVLLDGINGKKDASTTEKKAALESFQKLDKAQDFAQRSLLEAERVGDVAKSVLESAKAANHIASLAKTRASDALDLIRKSESLFRNYFELGQVGMAVTSPDQKWLNVNQRLCEMLGYTAEELNEKTWTELTHPDDLEPDLVQFKRLLSGEIKRYSMDKRFIHKNGSIVYTHLTVACQRKPDNEVEYFIASLQDITERKANENELERQRDNFTRVLNAITDGIYVVNRGYDVEYVNPAIEREFGKVEGRKCYAYFHDRGEPCPWCKNDDVFKGNTVRWEWFSAKTGKTYDLLDTPITNPDGTVSKFEIFHDITGLKLAEAALRESEERYRGLFENKHTVMFVINPNDGIIVDANPAAANYYGWTREELRQKNISDINLLSPDQIHAEMELARAEKRNYFVFRHRRAHGEPRDVEVYSGPVQIEGRSLLYSIVIDITERKRAQEALLEVRKLLDETQQLSKLGGWKYDCATKRISWTEEVYRIYGVGRDYDPNDVHKDIEFYSPEDRGTITQAFNNAVLNGEPYDLELQLTRLNGEHIWVRTIGKPTLENGEIVSVSGNIMDITERKQAQEQIHKLAFYDSLTQLPNRRLCFDRLGQAMVASKRSKLFGALMFLDLDNFKPLNDAYGHGVGDLLLIEVAHRLTRCVREMDTVARFGGDEFIVLLNELDEDKAKSVAQAESVAKKINAALSEPYVLTVQSGNKQALTIEHRCTSSIGVVVFFNHEISVEDMLNRADKAMYQAKNSGRNSVRLYNAAP